MKRAAAVVLIVLAGCADTAVVAIENGGSEVASFEVKRPTRRDGAVILRLERTDKRFHDWLRIEIPAWPEEESDILFATLNVKAEFLRDWSNGGLERASEVSNGTVRVIRSSGLAGSTFRFECSITFARVTDAAGKDLGKKKFDVNFDAPVRER